MADLQKLYKGWVTHVIDPGSFWMQIGTDNGFDEFQMYQANIDDYINTSSDSLVVAASDLSQGDRVVVRNRSGRKQIKWRRARVSRVEGDSVDVFFVDYGYTEIINIEDIRMIQVPVFDYLSPQAIRVELAGIQSLTRSWTSRAVSMFKEKVFHKSLIVSVLEVDESQSLFVALYRRGGDGDWYSVTHAMLEEDLGVCNKYTLGFEKCISHDDVDKVLLKMNQEESAEAAEEAQEETEVSSNDGKEKEADTNNWQDTHKDGEEDIEIWDDSDNIERGNAVNHHRSDTNKNGGEDIEIWDDSDDIEGGNAVNNHQRNAVKDREDNIEVWDGAVTLEEDEVVDSVWEDAIEDLEESSSEDEALLARVNTNISNGSTGFTEVPHASNMSLEPEKDKENQLYPHSNFEASSSQEMAKSVGIPQFNIKPLSQTRAISANELQFEVEGRTQRKRVRDLQKDLHRYKEDLDEAVMHSTNIHWGRSDSQVGQPHIADESNLQDSISEELYNRFLGEVNEMEALGPSLNRKFRDIKEKTAQPIKSSVSKPLKPEKPEKSSTSQPELGSSIKASERQPITEEESYHLEKKIVEILINKKNETPEMLRVQLHDIIPAEKSLKPDLMAVVMTAVLESIIHQKCYDPGFALTILETYMGADAFPMVLNDTLKTLKDKFVKIPKHNQKCNHEEFASLLAMLFIQSQCWYPSICEAIQKYALSTVDKWIIFNKKRQQDQERTVNTEVIYLECVYVFMQQTRAILSDQFPEQTHFWLDEMREKLLHDLTDRSIRVVLLDILLNNVAGDGNAALFKPRRSSASVATQTGTGSGRGTPDISQLTSQGPFYKAPRGALYPRRDPFTPHNFQENNSKLPELFGSLSGFKPSFDLDSHLSKSEKSADLMPHSSSEYHDQETPQSHCNNATTGELKEDSYVVHLSDIQTSDEVVKEPDRLGSQASETHTGKDVTSEKSKPTTQAFPESVESSELNESNELVESEPLVKRITYTSAALRAMNPMNGMSRTAAQLKEPFELKHIFCRVEEDARSSEKENSPRPGGVACLRYAGDCSSPKELSLLDSNIEAYTPKIFEDNTSKDSFSSLNTNHNASSIDLNYSPLPGLLKTSTPDESYQSRNLPPVELEDWTHGISLQAGDQSSSNSFKEPADTDKSGEGVAAKVAWPDDFFLNAKRNLTALSEASSQDCETNQETPHTGAGKKKKKTKFRPLEEFLEEGRTFGVDEAEQGFNELDEFSDAALQMYVELEKEEEERGFQEAKLIHGPRLVSSTRPRASLFADARKAKATTKSTPWVPGKRKCTRCGSENHIWSECSEGTINNMDDMSYMF